MRKLLLILLAMTPIISACGATSKTTATTEGPEGDLLYCSFSETRHGGLGKVYCELIADPGTKPVIHVRININNDLEPDSETKGDFNVSEKVVKDLRAQLASAKVYKLDGYSLDEELCGGATYRIYMEYSSGEKVNARWFGHNVNPDALAAYALIERFFQPWIKKCSSH